MSKVTNQLSNSNHVINDYDFAKIFIWENRFDKATFKNNTGAIATFEAGTVLGRDSSDNTIVALNLANAANGQSIPVGILAEKIEDVAIGGTLPAVNYSTKGDVNADLITLVADAVDDAAADGRTIKDHLLSKSIRLIETDELTGPDNS